VSGRSVSRTYSSLRWVEIRPRELRFRRCAESVMKLDQEKIDRAVLALLRLGLHEDNRVWKGFDWDVLNRLHAKR